METEIVSDRHKLQGHCIFEYVEYFNLKVNIILYSNMYK